jgi:hypothetical protein
MGGALGLLNSLNVEIRLKKHKSNPKGDSDGEDDKLAIN